MRTLQRIMQVWLPAALAGVILILMPAVPADALVLANSDTPDQSQTVTGGGMPISGANYKVAQVVTANQYGFLDRVSLYMDNAGASGGEYVSVNIYAVTGGVPVSLIGVGSLPISALPPSGSPGWVDVKVSGTTKMLLAPGMQFAIVISAPQSGMIEWFLAGNVYPGGAALSCNAISCNSASVWSGLGGDAMFKTFVIADAIDQKQEQGGTQYNRIGTIQVGQTFTVGSPGFLERIGIRLYNSAATPAAIAISVRTLDSQGLPTETQVASGTIPISALPGYNSGGWAVGSITPMLVTPGAKYAVVFTTSAVGLDWDTGGNVYDGGSAMGKMLVGGGVRVWAAADWLDGTFRTYIVPPILDQQQATGIQQGALGAGSDAYVSFIPTWSGVLSEVGAWLGIDPAYQDVTPLTVTLKEYSTGNTIGTGAISAEFPEWTGACSPDGCGSPLWFYTALSGIAPRNVGVSAGTKYSLHLTATAGSVNWMYAGNPPIYDYQSYVLPYIAIVTAPPPGPTENITPCSGGICPRASGGFTPAAQADGITSRFHFQENPNGKVVSTLAFSDPSPGGITLKGCTTESENCMLTVKTFICTDTQSVRVSGTYTLRGETAKSFSLNLSGVASEPGTFTLNAGMYQYVLTQADIVDVSCPPVVGLGID